MFAPKKEFETTLVFHLISSMITKIKNSYFQKRKNAFFKFILIFLSNKVTNFSFLLLLYLSFI
ncbi:hypothetical protein DMB95_07210 [Campylobacter sp. MIT 12-8780]|nr:hypothetical protein DMB95_07210 [Campylobacter sp. MIT 12-8780]